MWTENLDKYLEEENTTSCYLDGRYFEKVLSNYPGLLYHPLQIRISEKVRKETSKKAVHFEEDSKLYIHMVQQNINMDQAGLLRVVITTSTSRHCNLLILDYKNGVVYRFEPLGRKAPYFDKINKLIEEYLSFFFDFELKIIDIELDEILDEKNEDCLKRGERSGFCTAYILLYAYSYLHGKDYDPSEIGRFAKMVERTYGSLAGLPEKDYGLFSGGNYDPKTQNVLIGAGIGSLGGLVLGGGVGGLVLGGIGGGLIGSAL